jgi:hypothetical protein
MTLQCDDSLVEAIPAMGASELSTLDLAHVMPSSRCLHLVLCSSYCKGAI